MYKLNSAYCYYDAVTFSLFFSCMKFYMQFLTHTINIHTYCIHNSTICYFLLGILEKIYYCVYCMCTYCVYCMCTYYVYCMCTYYVYCMCTYCVYCTCTYCVYCMCTYCVYCMCTYCVYCMCTYFFYK